MVHFGHTVKLDNLAPSSNLHPKLACEDFYKDLYCWEHYNVNYTDYMQDIIDKVCVIQDDLDRVSNYSDIALVDFMYGTNNTNIHTSPGPDLLVQIELIQKCIQDYLNIAHMIRNTGLPNYRWARVPISSGLRIDAWEHHLHHSSPFLLDQKTLINLESFLTYFTSKGPHLMIKWIG